METLALKKRIKNYVDSADDRMLRIFNAIIDSGSEDSLAMEHQGILDHRLQFHNDNPEDGKSWTEVKESLENTLNN